MREEEKEKEETMEKKRKKGEPRTELSRFKRLVKRSERQGMLFAMLHTPELYRPKSGSSSANGNEQHGEGGRVGWGREGRGCKI